VSSRKPRRLIRSAWVDLPVAEASGLAVRFVDGRAQVLVVGDRTAQVATGTYIPGEGIAAWQTIDLSTVPGWPIPHHDSQFEAIAVDGGSLVAIMREDPPLILVADTATEKLVAHIRLVAPPDSPLHGRWDDPSSRGEGLVLLRGGRILVAKEKRPRALVEFTPKGVTSRGLSRDDFLDAGEAWEAPDGDVDYAATAMWRLCGPAKDALHDISALGVGPDRSLWLLSDKSRSVARLSLDTPLRPSDDEIRDLQEIWRLPKHTKKPEGVAAIDEDHILVAMDTKSMFDNGVIVQRPPA
jgi:hypothetical protein